MIRYPSLITAQSWQWVQSIKVYVMSRVEPALAHAPSSVGPKRRHAEEMRVASNVLGPPRGGHLHWPPKGPLARGAKARLAMAGAPVIPAWSSVLGIDVLESAELIDELAPLEHYLQLLAFGEAADDVWALPIGHAVGANFEENHPRHSPLDAGQAQRAT